MSREQDIKLLTEYGVAYLEQGKDSIGKAFIMFAGNVALKEQYPEWVEPESSES